jgi:glycosyltransferase involved in cell wall biosynthesis
MNQKISIVINTLNEEKNIARCLQAVKWANDIVLVDMYSTDKTVKIAKKFGTRVYFHKRIGYVEPARNFAISKAKNKWVLVLDADEIIPKTLSNKLQQIVNQKNNITHVLIPRKNIVLGRWLKYSAEWAGHQTRLFKKDKVDWPSDIHKQPKVEGKSTRLPAVEKYAITHHYYSSIRELLDKFDIYSTQHAVRLINDDKYVFKQADIVIKPIIEFLNRYIFSRGFLDKTEGFIHCCLMSYYYFLVYTKIWEKQR